MTDDDIDGEEPMTAEEHRLFARYVQRTIREVLLLSRWLPEIAAQSTEIELLEGWWNLPSWTTDTQAGY